jgi:hypothetical protein
MALRNCVSFLCGDFSEIGSGQGSIVSSPSYVTGGYSWKCNPTTSGTQYIAIGDVAADGTNVSVNSDNGFAVTRPTTLFARFYFQWTTKAASGAEPICVFFTTSLLGSSVISINKMTVMLDSNGKLAAYNSGNTLMATGSTVLSSGTWYRVEVKCGTGSSAAWEVKINGTSEISGTGNLDTHAHQNFYLGKQWNHSSQSVVYNFACVYLDDAAYPGAGTQAILTPSAAGHYTTGWQNGSGNPVTYINSIPTDTTKYFGDSTATDVNTYTTAGLTGVNTIAAVKGLLICKQTFTSGSPTIKARLRSSSTDSDTSAVNEGSSFRGLTINKTTDPATSAAWTASGLNAAEFGMVDQATGSGGQHRVCAAFIIVDYVAANTYNETMSGGAYATNPSTPVKYTANLTADNAGPLAAGSALISTGFAALFVQSATGTVEDSHSISATFANPSTSGNLLIATLSTSDKTISFGGISGFTQFNSVTNGNEEIYLFYRAGAPVTSTITITASGGTGFSSETLVIAEYGGIAPTPTDGASLTSTGSSTSPASASLTTSNAQDLIIWVIGQRTTANSGPSFSAPTNGFTLRAQTSDVNQDNSPSSYVGTAIALLDNIVSSTGTYSSAVTSTVSDQWATIIGAFKVQVVNTYFEIMNGGAYATDPATPVQVSYNPTPESGAVANSGDIDQATYNIAASTDGPLVGGSALPAVVTHNGSLLLLGAGA